LFSSGSFFLITKIDKKLGYFLPPVKLRNNFGKKMVWATFRVTF
jgi:hypothetical protein